jgi:hypothetical protein
MQISMYRMRGRCGNCLSHYNVIHNCELIHNVCEQLNSHKVAVLVRRDFIGLSRPVSVPRARASARLPTPVRMAGGR